MRLIKMFGLDANVESAFAATALPGAGASGLSGRSALRLGLLQPVSDPENHQGAASLVAPATKPSFAQTLNE